MFATPHLLAGAATAKALRRPWIALPAAFVSHLVLDSIPHLDSHGLLRGDNLTPTITECLAVSADLLIGAALLLLLSRGQPLRKLMMAGAFSGMLLDFAYAAPIWGEPLCKWPITGWLGAIHGKAQNNASPGDWLLAFGTQAGVIVIAGWLVRRKVRRLGDCG